MLTAVFIEFEQEILRILIGRCVLISIRSLIGLISSNSSIA